jgi:hypothetical protein
MRAVRILRVGGLLLAVLTGPVAFIGCSDNSKSPGTVVEVNKQEQDQMQNAMRNFMQEKQSKKKGR